MDKEEFVNFLIESNVLRFGEFITKSGRKSPYFINTGLYDDGKKLSILGKFYAEVVNRDFPDVTLLFGPAYKGIPLSVITSIKLYEEYGKVVKVSYNRKESKDHGEGGTIIGSHVSKDDKVVIIEDVITSGLSIRESMEILKKNGNPKVVGVVVSVDRLEKGNFDIASKEIEDEFKVKVCPIITIADILDYLKKSNSIDSDVIKSIEEYLSSVNR